MNIRKLFFLIAVFCLIFFAIACAQTSVATPMRTVSTWTSSASGNLSPTQTAILIETEIATAAAEIAVPQNSPWVVYVKGGNIWLWDAANSPQQLTRSGQDSSPKISDDAQIIVFRRNADLWVVDARGSNAHLLVSGALLPRRFDFAPHTHDVYFNTSILAGNSLMPQDNLMRINTDSAELRPLLGATQGGEEFVFSPDGKQIALPCKDKINVASLDGSSLKTVFTFPLVVMYSEIPYIPEIVWLPDGSGFKTVIPAPDPLADPAARTRLMFISADGKIVAKLAEFVASPVFINRPFISPDGSRVMYTKAHGSNLELHIIDASTADQMYFSHAAESFGILGWAPDSRHVVYWLDDRRRIWLSTQQNDAIPLSDVTFADNFIWADAQHYFFTNASELRFRTLGQPSILLDGSLSENGFDFTTLH